MNNPFAKKNPAESEDLSPYAVDAKFYFGTVIERPAANYCKVKIDGCPTVMNTTVKNAQGLTTAVNARVVIMEMNGTFMVIFRIPS